MSRCARCGNEIPAGSVFCTYCGIPVASAAAAAPGSGAQMPQPGTAASGFAPNTVPGTGTLPPVPQPAGPADNGGSAPQGQPGSQSQPGKKPPLTPAQRKKRKIIIGHHRGHRRRGDRRRRSCRIPHPSRQEERGRGPRADHRHD
nr:zinc ribbon domain-containing protein [Bifidobacterium bifidum]